MAILKRKLDLRKYMSDIYYTGILSQNSFRFTLIDCSEVCTKISEIHRMEERISNFLSKTLMGAFFLARMIKGEQKISIQWKDEYKQSVLAYSNRQGEMKGVAYPGELEEGDIRNDFILGTGILKVIRWREGADPYTSFTTLIEDTFENNLRKYIRDSEQILTGIYMDSGRIENGKQVAKGLFLQALPESSGRSHTDLLTTFDRIFSGTRIWEQPIDEIYNQMGRILQEEIVELDSGIPTFQCDCSREKISEVLISLGEDEIKNILLDEGQIRVECEFCKSIYIFDKADTEILFSSQ